MLLKIVLLTVCVATASASSACGTIQRGVVQAQWARAQGNGNSRVDFGGAVFDKFFEGTPEARAVFSSVNGDNIYSAKFKSHALRVVGGLDRAISLLGTSEGNSDLAHLKTQHDPREIPAAYWDVFKGVLLDVVAGEIGLCFNQDAWNACVSDILALMH